MAQKKTTDKGNFQIDSLPAGSYIAKISKPGYADQIVTFTIVQGELTSLGGSLRQLPVLRFAVKGLGERLVAKSSSTRTRNGT